MTSKQDHDEWVKGTNLTDAGFDLKPQPAVRIHNRNETDKHLLVKAMVAKVLWDRGHKFDTEVQAPGGRVDVLDFGLPEDPPVVYEVETDCSEQVREEKVAQYAVDPVRDVLFLDPTEAPDSIPELREWVERRVVG